MAAFLYRLAGSPSYRLPSTSRFRDVPLRSQFAKEIHWLASTGITTGWPDGTFRPVTPVTREAMAAFLYRFWHKVLLGMPTDGGRRPYGGWFAFRSGLSVSVSAPQPYTPSSTAAGHEGYPAAVVTTVTLRNDTGGAISPFDIWVSADSASQEASEIFDMDRGIDGPPDISIAPGSSASWKVAFGVDDARDVVVRIKVFTSDFGTAYFAS
ncbi:S-layer homology domain-containing protein [Brachybacterium sillae]|uniref:S-layer homology domain-containing protein n=1 Tax=Brachybacterium sillae TaxID=2810536 RepID=UPI00217E58B9|nr:S-layer homology domain-containing protein [Brachybacterium sillae]